MLWRGWLGSTILLFLPVSAVFIPAECPDRLLFSRMTLWLSPSTTRSLDLSPSSGDRIGLSSSLPEAIFGSQLSWMVPFEVKKNTTRLGGGAVAACASSRGTNG